MAYSIQLRFAWLVVSLALAGCPSEKQEDLECSAVKWEQTGVDEDDISEYMNAKFEIKTHEIEIAKPCASGEDFLVTIYGKGGAVPRHQVWLAIITHGKIDIAPSE